MRVFLMEVNQGPFVESQDPEVKVIHQRRIAALLKLRGLTGNSREGAKGIVLTW